MCIRDSVYEHSLIVLEQAIALEGRTNPADAAYPMVTGPDLVLRLSALLHDIGKPATRTFEGGGGVSFHHHELVLSLIHISEPTRPY